MESPVTVLCLPDHSRVVMPAYRQHGAAARCTPGVTPPRQAESRSAWRGERSAAGLPAVCVPVTCLRVRRAAGRPSPAVAQCPIPRRPVCHRGGQRRGACDPTSQDPEGERDQDSRAAQRRHQQDEGRHRHDSGEQHCGRRGTLPVDQQQDPDTGDDVAGQREPSWSRAMTRSSQSCQRKPRAQQHRDAAGPLSACSLTLQHPPTRQR